MADPKVSFLLRGTRLAVRKCFFFVLFFVHSIDMARYGGGGGVIMELIVMLPGYLVTW